MFIRCLTLLFIVSVHHVNGLSVETTEGPLAQISPAPSLLEKWEFLKRNYAQKFSKSEKDALRAQIISEIALLNQEELKFLSEISWFWNIILADVIQAARSQMTKNLSAAALEVLASRLRHAGLAKQGADVPRILSIIIENLADEDLPQKLRPFLAGVENSAQLSDDIKKRLVPMRIAQARAGSPSEELDNFNQDLARADMTRKQKSPKPTDPAWLLSLGLADIKSMALEKGGWDSLWRALNLAKPELINQISPNILEFIFEELTKDPSYKSIGAIIAGSRLEMAKKLIQKLNPDGIEFAKLFDGILNGVWSNITPLADTLMAKAKKSKSPEETANYVGLINKAKLEKLAAINQAKEADRAFQEEYRRAAQKEQPSMASGQFWLSGSAAQARPRSFKIIEIPELYQWLTEGYRETKDIENSKMHLANIIKYYLSADDSLRDDMAKVFAKAVANSDPSHDLLDVIDNIDNEESSALITQLLIGNDERGYPIIHKLWKHETKAAGLRGKSAEEIAIRRLAFLLHYLSREQLQDSLRSDAFWVILSTYPEVGATGLSPEQLSVLSSNIHQPEIKKLRGDLPNILARLAIRLDQNRPDLFNALLAMARHAEDIVLAEAIKSKFRAFKASLIKSVGAPAANEAENLLSDTLRESRRIKMHSAEPQPGA